MPLPTSSARTALLLPSLALIAGACPASAQIPEMPSGTRVRVTASSLVPRPIAGPLLARTDDALTLGLPDQAVRLTIPMAAIEGLQESGGRPRLRYALNGAGVGALAAGSLLALAGYAADPGGWGGPLAIVGFVTGAAVGAPLGAGVGALVAPEQWAEAHTAALPAPAPGGRLGLEVDPGTPLRVTPAGGRRFVAPVRVRADTLWAELAEGPRSYRLDEIGSLETRVGRNRRKGAAIGGAAIGGVALVFGGLDLVRDEIGAGELLAAVIGNAVIGAGVGALLAPRGWRAVPLPGTARAGR
ncbi:MAG: hypothetical protein KY466_04875 [Gemmatimonadetes bacterium]|nr:hypothetical protein [Gemmatimonadota bacterium]